MKTAYRILKNPHVTEKAEFLTKNNQYIFKVSKEANKNLVKKAVKEVFGADAVSVKIINVARKKKRLGRTMGMSGGYKKAIVKIKEGQKIETLPR